MKQKVYLQIGPYSSVGGVNVHMLRLAHLFKKDYNFKYIDESPIIDNNNDVYNIRSKNLFRYIQLIKTSDIVHIHTGVWWLRCIHILFSRLLLKKVIVTIHSLSNLQSKSAINITRLFLGFSNSTIVVSEQIIKVMKLKKAEIIPAFLPPILEEEPLLPLNVIEILEENYNKKIIVSNAFDLVMHNNEDLYGLDLLIDVARRIKSEKKDYKIIFILASITKNTDLLHEYNETIRKESLDNYISIILETISFVRLVKESDVVIRATNTDGDALTVREAIYFNKKVIASDIVKRPNHTILFKNRSSDDLFQKIKIVLENNISAQKAEHKACQNFKEYYNPVLDRV